MANFPVNITVKAFDKVSSKFEAINKKFERLNESSNKLKLQFKALSRSLNLDAIKNSLGRVGKSFSSLGAGVRSSLTRLGAVAGIAAGGVFALAKTTSAALDDMNDLAKRVGFSTTSLQQLNFAAEQNGVSAEDFGRALGF